MRVGDDPDAWWLGPRRVHLDGEPATWRRIPRHVVGAEQDDLQVGAYAILGRTHLIALGPENTGVAADYPNALDHLR